MCVTLLKVRGDTSVSSLWRGGHRTRSDGDWPHSADQVSVSAIIRGVAIGEAFVATSSIPTRDKRNR